MEEKNLFALSNIGDIVGVMLIVVIAIGAGHLIWKDYNRTREGNRRQRVKFWDFIKKEQLYIFLFLMFLFLIGGEILLYNRIWQFLTHISRIYCVECVVECNVYFVNKMLQMYNVLNVFYYDNESELQRSDLGVSLRADCGLPLRIKMRM